METKDHTKASVGLSEGQTSFKSRNKDATARVKNQNSNQMKYELKPGLPLAQLTNSFKGDLRLCSQGMSAWCGPACTLEQQPCFHLVRC